MSRRIFVTVQRGMTDKTPVCVYPWELDLLQHIHGESVEEVTIEAMCDLSDAAKVEKQKLKKLPGAQQQYAPDMRAQLEAMAYVDPEEDPANDPAAEYNRLIEKYGMDKDFPVPVVERIFGPHTSDKSAFAMKLRQYAEERAAAPRIDGGDKAPGDMSINELRKTLSARGVAWRVNQSKAELIDMLTEALVA